MGAQKKALLDAGASLSPTDAAYAAHFMGAAMLETEHLDVNYALGDNKTGDSFSAGAAKQNWLMLRQCHAAWTNLGPEDYLTAEAINSDRALDIQIYAECRRFFGDSWWGGHLAGKSGLANPDADMIRNYKAFAEWIYQVLERDPSGNHHFCDDTRFWVDVHMP